MYITLAWQWKIPICIYICTEQEIRLLSSTSYNMYTIKPLWKYISKLQGFSNTLSNIVIKMNTTWSNKTTVELRTKIIKITWSKHKVIISSNNKPALYKKKKNLCDKCSFFFSNSIKYWDCWSFLKDYQYFIPN